MTVRISESQRDHIIRLLERDVEATIGVGHEYMILDCAENLRSIFQENADLEASGEPVKEFMDLAHFREGVSEDAEATIGVSHEYMISAENLKSIFQEKADLEAKSEPVEEFVDDLAHFKDRVVEDVQQYFHDCFIDTTWPRCPKHLSHPLWFVGGNWSCLQDQKTYAELGKLEEAYAA